MLYHLFIHIIKPVILQGFFFASAVFYYIGTSQGFAHVFVHVNISLSLFVLHTT